MIDLKIVKLNEHAKTPHKARYSIFEDAAFDLYCLESFELLPGETKKINTGIKMIIPEGYWIKFHERSGLALNHGIQVLGGVIDSGYSGELLVILHNCSLNMFSRVGGSSIAQFTVEKLTRAHISTVPEEEFMREEARRERKSAGFGSSDIKTTNTDVSFK